MLLVVFYKVSERHVCSSSRTQEKVKQFRRLKLEEVKILAEEGIKLDMSEYLRKVEEREEERRKQKDERMAREALLTLEALEREEQEQAEAALRGAGEENRSAWILNI